jgi:hypothetical protein
VGEDIAEMDYQPLKCARKYRLVIVRKNISVQKGERALLDEIKYLFYITNRKDKAPQIVGLANGRCDQENVIEQFKNGVNAMRMPVNDSDEQLGVHGHRQLGVEPQELVWAADARAGTRVGTGEDGISAFPQRHHVNPVPDCAHGSPSHLPRPGIQQLVK